MIVFAATVSWVLWLVIFLGCFVAIFAGKNRGGRH